MRTLVTDGFMGEDDPFSLFKRELYERVQTVPDILARSGEVTARIDERLEDWESERRALGWTAARLYDEDNRPE